MSDEIKLNPTSADSAKVSDVILRETSTTRLVFRPLVVNNRQDANQPVKGTFLFQRRKSDDVWEDHKDLDMSKLKAEEWIKLDLKCTEISALYAALTNLYEIYAAHSIPSLGSRFVKVPDPPFGQHLDTETILKIASANSQVGADALVGLFEWATSVDNLNEVVKKLKTLDAASLSNLSTVVGLSSIKRCFSEWSQNRANDSEEFWQKHLSDNAFVLSQIMPYPVLIMAQKAYVGGKSIHNTGGSIVDFILQNQLSKNIAFVEIKTPMTKLLTSTYRNGVYNVSPELTGAVQQVINYKATFLREELSIASNSSENFTAFDPNCIVIAGNFRKEFDGNKDQIKSFELFRSQLRNVVIVTYDELFLSLKSLVSFMESGLATTSDAPGSAAQ